MMTNENKTRPERSGPTASKRPRETAARDVIDSILRDEDRQSKRADMLQGSGISLTIGNPGKGEEDFVVCITADVPVLRPDGPVPAQPVP